MAYTGPAELSPQVQQYYDSQILATETPHLIYGYAADRRRMPSKMGDTFRYSRYDRLPKAMVPLADDGSIPTPTSVNRIDLDAKVQYYGLYIAANSRVVLNNQDEVLNNFAELCGMSLRETEDALIRDCLMSSASIYNCTAGTNGDLPSNISVPDCDNVTEMLYTNNAWFVGSRQRGEDRFGTGPLAESYIAMAHSAVLKDLNSLAGFLKKSAYPNPESTLSSEWGAINNIRFLLSSEAASRPFASALGSTVYPIAVTGLEAYSVIEQDNYSSRFIYRPPEYNDPLLQSFTVGYTTAQGSRIINDLWIIVMNVTLHS